MSPTEILSGVNFALVLFFGALLTISFAGGCKTRRERAVLTALYLLLLAIQTASWRMFGLDSSKRFYPLYIHLPLLIGLTLGLKKPVGITLVSICAAYLCCQLPRCGAILTAVVTDSALAEQIVYTIIIVPIFFCLLRYFAPSARDTMAESPWAMLLFGSLPALYYLYDYTIAVWLKFLYSDPLSSGHIYSGAQMTAEILPTTAGLLYMVYITAYRRQLRRRIDAELLSSLMEGQLRQAETEMSALRRAEAQAAAYHHDMRHHLTAIDGYLAAGNFRQAREYIGKVWTGIALITPERYCENELVNLLCSSFSAKAKQADVRLKVEAAVPASLAIADTALCALLSNGLENALNAVEGLEQERRWVEVFCGIHLDKLLIEIRNPYAGCVTFRDGLPFTARPNHGHGCRSIHAITLDNRGLYEFKAECEVFTLRVALPVEQGSRQTCQRPETVP